MSDRAIVVVDREEGPIEALKRVLGSAGVSVYGSTEPVHARHLIEAYPPAVLIIDPVVDDSASLVHRARSASPSVRVIAFTWPREVDLDSPEHRLDALEARAMVDQVVLKTAGLEDLAAAVRLGLGEEMIIDVAQPAGVLVVDDDRVVRESVRLQLDPRRYEVMTAKSGQQALQLLDLYPGIAVVLLDVILPDIGGFDLLTEIQRREPRPGIIMISVLADRVVARHALEMGAFDYLLKPLEADKLEAAIAACMGVSEFQKLPWWRRIAS